jgi:UDP-N-acetylglucosamine pyrophosphorylase
LGTLKSRSQCLQIFPEVSCASVNEIKETNEKSLHFIFKKYHNDNSLNSKTKNLLFSEEVKKFKREDVLEFCEELEGEFCKELEERVLLNTSKQTDQENASLKNLKDGISLIEKLETAKQELNAYVNSQAVIQRIGLF